MSELKNRISKAMETKDAETLGALVLSGELSTIPTSEITAAIQDATLAAKDLTKILLLFNTFLDMLIPFLDAELVEKVKRATEKVRKKLAAPNFDINSWTSVAGLAIPMAKMVFALPKKELSEAVKKVDTTAIRAMDWEEFNELAVRRNINLLPFAHFVLNNIVTPKKD